MTTILWQRHDRAGMDVCTLAVSADGARLAGTVLTSLDERPAEVRYVVEADAGWGTRRVRIGLSIGGERRALTLEADGAGTWLRDGSPLPEAAGILDVDLEVTPATNTLPLRRLALTPGASAAVTALWVRFPSLACERSDQEYAALGGGGFVYRSGSFAANLDVDADGLVTRYGSIWSTVAVTAVR
ncbi:MAG: putative glycolipid-binding domain-containing protein [Chloroflexota bacterium]|nr:putative glycolipid-binding domain-containing protein [Chloroflexota bacterium]